MHGETETGRAPRVVWVIGHALLVAAAAAILLGGGYAALGRLLGVEWSDAR